MSDTATDTNAVTPDGNSPSGETSAAGTEFKPITSQDDLNKLIDDRLKRERAKFADYGDLKRKAGERDAEVERSKSDIEKAMDRVNKAEAEVGTVPAKVADALRTHLVALHEINDEDAELFLTAQDPELLLKQVERLTGRQAAGTKKTNVVPREGATSPSVDSPQRQTVRALFAG
jgi:hypothetical protein